MILYSLSDSRIIKSRTMRWAKYVTTTGKRKRAHRAFGRKAEGKRELENSRRRWVFKIILFLQEIGLFWLMIGKIDRPF